MRPRSHGGEQVKDAKDLEAEFASIVFDLSARMRLTLIVGTWSSLAAFFVLVLAAWGFERQAAAAARDELVRARKGLSKASQRGREDLVTAVRGLAVDAEVLRWLAASSKVGGPEDTGAVAGFNTIAAGLQARLSAQPLLSRFPAAALLNSAGEVVWNRAGPEIGLDASSWWSFTEAQAGRSSEDWWQVEEHSAFLPQGEEAGMYRMLAAGMLEGNALRGVLIVGEPLGVLERAAVASPVEWIFLDATKEVVTSSMDDWKSRSELAMDLARMASLGGGEISAAGVRYSTIILPLASNGRQLGTLALIRETSTASHARLLLWLQVAAGLVAAIFAAAFFAASHYERWLQPLYEDLKAKMRRLASGDFSVRSESRHRDDSGLRDSFNHMAENLQKGGGAEEAIRRYVSSDVLAHFSDQRQLKKTSGSREDLSLLSCHVELPSVSESEIEAGDVVERLNRCHAALAGIIERRGGHVERCAGETLYAFWNAPKRSGDHALRAAQSALEMLRWFSSDEAENWRWERGRAPSCRIGLHFARSLVGNVGPPQRLHYSAWGPGTRYAGRICGLGELYGARILLSDPFKNQLDGRYLLRPLDRVSEREGDIPFLVYELIEERERLSSDRILFCEGFVRMLQAYWSGSILEALTLCEGLGLEDPAVRLYAARCRGRLQDLDGAGKRQEG